LLFNYFVISCTNVDRNPKVNWSIWLKWLNVNVKWLNVKVKYFLLLN